MSNAYGIRQDFDKAFCFLHSFFFKMKVLLQLRVCSLPSQREAELNEVGLIFFTAFGKAEGKILILNCLQISRQAPLLPHKDVTLQLQKSFSRIALQQIVTDN